MGPIEQWHWIDPLGRLRWRDCEQDPFLPLRIRPAQLDPLRRTGMVQGCLQMLARAGRRGDAVLLGQQLDAGLAEALHRHGLRDEADRRLFAVQALAIPGGPQHHPLLRAALERAAAGQISYVGACAELTDDPLGIPAKESSPHRSWEQAT
ncbi:hypothetical protein [Cupriavidus sp. AU9028]|uniref:hypothetical protein n=1 Tax=Cupriavidus sp. AU9028 TaxID=2871157 RepID=UPI001C9526C6|nr:hypothetical protein [Cupriavidus sp. AU9028]MBY4897510.1 hypothetical protein [Cupriavidus sp. AU9028]